MQLNLESQATLKFTRFSAMKILYKALEPIRHEIIFAGKYSPTPLPEQNFPEGKLSKGGLNHALEDSLKRLRTDYLDIYFVHRLPQEVEVEELAEWFGELIKAGKIRLKTFYETF